MTYQSEVITTSDGRSLEVAKVGANDGATVFFHHGTPAAASFVKMFDGAASAHALSIVTISRAGYGRSDRREARSVSDVVTDAHCALDHFDRDRYVALGWSGGGPHALACAALDSPRCRAAISLAGVAPADVDFDWTEGMGPENVEEFALARRGGVEYEEHMKAVSSAMREVTESTLIAAFGGLLSDVDKAALADGVARSALAEATADSALRGHYGFLDDDQAILSPWGFELQSIRVPVEIWFGDNDLMVPPMHGQYLADTIPNSVRFHQSTEGHASIVANYQNELFRRLANYAID